MKVVCHFPGCKVKGHNYKNRSLEDSLSFHIVPVELTATVAQLINGEIPGPQNPRLLLCSAHFREGSFTALRQTARGLRKDIPFLELLKVTNDTPLIPSTTAVSRIGGGKRKREESLERQEKTPKPSKLPRKSPSSGRPKTPGPKSKAFKFYCCSGQPASLIIFNFWVL